MPPLLPVCTYLASSPYQPSQRFSYEEAAPRPWNSSTRLAVHWRVELFEQASAWYSPLAHGLRHAAHTRGVSSVQELFSKYACVEESLHWRAQGAQTRFCLGVQDLRPYISAGHVSHGARTPLEQ